MKIYLKDYTYFPAGPSLTDGPANAETFRMEWVQPALAQGSVLLDLTGTMGLAYNYMSQIVNFPDTFQVISGTIDPDRNIYTYKYIYQNELRTLQIVNELSSYSIGFDTLFKERIEKSYRVIDFAKEYTPVPSTHKASYDIGRDVSFPRDAETFKTNILAPALQGGHVFLNMSNINISMMVYYREILDIPNAKLFMINSNKEYHTLVYKIDGTLRALVIHSDLEWEMALWGRVLYNITLDYENLGRFLVIERPIEALVNPEQPLTLKTVGRPLYGLWMRLYLAFLRLFQKQV